MWQKIKDYFDQTVTQIIEIIIMTLCAIGLVIGGWKGAGFHSFVDYVGGAIIAKVVIIKLIKIIMHRIGGD